MTEIEALLRAIKTLRPELPALVGRDWAQFEVQLDTYLAQMAARPPMMRVSFLRAQILMLFSRYSQAQQRLATLMAKSQEIRSTTREALPRGEVTPRSPINAHTGLRYLNAGFFTAGSNDRPAASEQPLSLADAPYRLGVNVGEFWGLGTPDTPIPDDVLKPLFDQYPELTLDVAVRSFTVTLPVPYQRLPLAASGNSPMLFFPVEFPKVGWHTIAIDLIYCGHLLQSRRVQAYVVEHTGDPVPKSAWPVKPQAGRQDAQDAYITFTRTAAFDPESLKSLAERPSQLTVVLEHDQNDNPVGLRFYNTSAGVERLGSAEWNITDTSLVGLLKLVRNQLQTTMEDYALGAVSTKREITAQFDKWANVGWHLYCALLPDLSVADPENDTLLKLLDGMKPGTIIQVAPLSKQLSVPWEVLYDRPHVGDSQGRTKLCPDFRTHGPKLADCPHHEDPNVVCPHGFWGYRYIIEQLPCRSERGDPPRPALPMYIRNDLPLKFTLSIRWNF